MLGHWKAQPDIKWLRSEVFGWQEADLAFRHFGTPHVEYVSRLVWRISLGCWQSKLSYATLRNSQHHLLSHIQTLWKFTMTFHHQPLTTPRGIITVCESVCLFTMQQWLTALLLPIPQIIFLLLLLLLLLWEQMSMAGTGGSNLTGSLETSAQLQLPHVAHHRCGIKRLLHEKRERQREGRYKPSNLTASEGEKQQGRTKCAPAPASLNTAPSAGCSAIQPKTLTFHLLLAKFFLIWALTDSWIFLSRAVSPQILQSQRELENNSAMSRRPVRLNIWQLIDRYTINRKWCC